MKTNKAVLALMWMLTGSALLEAGVVYTKLESPALPITNFSTVDSSLLIEDSAEIHSLTLRINRLTHTSVGDLTIFLIAPNLTSVLVFDRHGGGGQDLHDTWLDDRTNYAIGNETAPFHGIFAPDNPMAAFIGLSTAGTWTLRVHDNAGSDEGFLISWGIAVDEPIPEPSTAGLFGISAVFGGVVSWRRRTTRS